MKNNSMEYMNDELINVLEPISDLHIKAYGVLSEVLNRLTEDGEDTLDFGC